MEDLKQINQKLWDIEDNIRDKEKTKTFGKDIEKEKNKILKKITLYPLITLAASTGSALLVFDYFNYFSFISITANLLIIPFVSIFYTLNIFHFFILLIFNCNFFHAFHELFFLFIYKVIDYCSFLNTFFPIQNEYQSDINNGFHIVLFLILLLSFMFIGIVIKSPVDFSLYRTHTFSDNNISE